ncbi:MAG TPA: hypothetical protein VFR93_04550 [Candidatus Limnocylindrales bacterium]|nr:hypothetical protein [Candidatus Limnocylindrales bacterium]
MGFLVLLPVGVSAMQVGASGETGLVAIVAAGVAGLVIGAARLGWTALVVAFVSAVVVGGLPYWLIGTSFGWGDQALGSLLGFAPPVVAAAVAAVLGALVGRRFGPRVDLDGRLLGAAGLVALVLCLAAWLTLYLFGGRAA